MQFTSYRYKGVIDAWEFNVPKFNDVNLIVGDTSTGKTKFLETLFALGQFSVAESAHRIGIWDVNFNINGSNYKWHIESIEDQDKCIVANELLLKIENGNEITLVKRTNDSFTYCASELPKLTKDKPSIYILKDEEQIKPIYDGLCRIMFRRFYSDVIQKAIEPSFINHNHVKRILHTLDKYTLFVSDVPLNCKLYILNKYFKDIFRQIEQLFKTAFPYVNKFEIRDLSEFNRKLPPGELIPTLAITETQVKEWIPLPSFSSGMLKILLLITDITTLPEGSIYLIDEYENSLGTSAINFFPILLEELPSENQYIITSHHPYIINKMDMNNWIIFKRSGSSVTTKYGDSLKGKFERSKQEAYTQLINELVHIG